MADQSAIQGLAGNASGLNGQAFQLAQLPSVPEDVKKRFPSMIEYENQMRAWHKQLLFGVKQALGTGIAN